MATLKKVDQGEQLIALDKGDWICLYFNFSLE